jgi:NAD+ synthase
MCGGYSVLKDIYKTEVYALAHWRNGHLAAGSCGPSGRAIPEASITRAPTAELRPNQTDQDSLPPYEVLDSILHGLIEEELSVAEIARVASIVKRCRACNGCCTPQSTSGGRRHPE